MCLLCQEEDLYFLYLERLERAKRVARGETSPPNAHWLWPAFSTAPSAGAASGAAMKPREMPTFICDAPTE